MGAVSGGEWRERQHTHLGTDVYDVLGRVGVNAHDAAVGDGWTVPDHFALLGRCRACIGVRVVLDLVGLSFYIAVPVALTFACIQVVKVRALETLWVKKTF